MAMTLTGYAAVFDSESVNLGGFVEIIRRGAFARSLRDSQPIFGLYNHLSGELLGRRPGEMELEEDAKGLRFKVKLPDTQRARDAFQLVSSGILGGMSFGFRITDPEGELWYEDDRRRLVREVLDMELMEVSLTAFPAYPATSVSASGSRRSTRSVQLQAKRKWLRRLEDQHRRRLAA